MPGLLSEKLFDRKASDLDRLVKMPLFACSSYGSYILVVSDSKSGEFCFTVALLYDVMQWEDGYRRSLGQKNFALVKIPESASSENLDGFGTRKQKAIALHLYVRLLSPA